MKKLIWHCYKSGKVIDDGCGHIQITWSDLLKRRNDVKAWTEKHKATEDQGNLLLKFRAATLNAEQIGDYPSRVRWKSVLTEIEPYGDFYAIPVEQLRTELDCIRWSHHLITKNWLKETDWGMVLSRFCGY